MSGDQHIANIVIEAVRAVAPGFKRAYALHVAAALHGLRNAQTHAARRDAPLLPIAALPGALSAALSRYQVVLSTAQTQAVLERLTSSDRDVGVDELVETLLSPLEYWGGLPAELLQSVLEEHREELGPQPLGETMVLLAFAFADPVTTAALFRERRSLTPHRPEQVIQAALAVGAKLKYPELESPHSLLVEIDEVARRGEARGRVLWSPNAEFGCPQGYEEVLLHIPVGFEHQRPQDFLYASTRRGNLRYVVRSRSVHHGAEQTVPLRRVGERFTTTLPRD